MTRSGPPGAAEGEDNGAAVPLSRAERLFRRIADEPRPAGSAAEERARARAERVLTSSGFQTRRDAFDYSALPGRYGTPLAGVTIMGALAIAGHLAARMQRPGVALVVLVGVAALLFVAGRAATRRGVLELPVMRRTGENLVAIRGDGAASASPRVWLVAHLDTKSQPVPILVRAVAIVLSAAIWVAAIVLAVAQLAGVAQSTTDGLWPTLVIFGLVAALPVAGTTVGVRSKGAVDNASGVATVLRVAELLPPSAQIGILLTSAEELGLAGARAWARDNPGVSGSDRRIALNCDGVDDVGRVRAMYSGSAPAALLATVRSATSGRVAVNRLIPGILTDGVALADAGWETITLSKGALSTLLRIHSTRDDMRFMLGRGIEEAAQMLAAIASAVTADGTGRANQAIVTDAGLPPGGA